MESIMICKYPSIVECWTNERVEYEMDLVDSTVKSLRSLANERRERSPGYQSDRLGQVIGENGATPAGCAESFVNENLSVYLELQG
ncbi:hypothetical protein SO802_022707 [Lithocarpus litseifolius]|uniref:Uncharacterized protein n=1 Tax=Lithocarpus litseifolius TaxID=425828 RepID=A0AAW2C7R0_9ROSI